MQTLAELWAMLWAKASNDILLNIDLNEKRCEVIVWIQGQIKFNMKFKHSKKEANSGFHHILYCKYDKLLCWVSSFFFLYSNFTFR